MLRLFNVLVVSCLLATCLIVQAEQTWSSNKMYSVRPDNYQVPMMYYGTPSAPVFYRPQHAHAVQLRQFDVRKKPKPVPSDSTDLYAESVQLAPTVRPNQANRVVNAVPQPNPSNQSVGVVPPAPITYERSIEKTIIIRDEEPKINTDDELDALNARLAKIQLEKHNLADVLRLVKKIKSPTITAQTLVDLAEYVSRDINYRTEADQLYALAIVAIDAVNQNKPVTIGDDAVPSVQPIRQPEPVKVAPQPVEVKPELPKPVEIKPELPKPVEIKPELPKPVEVKPELPKPIEIKPETPKPIEIKPEPETTPKPIPLADPPQKEPQENTNKQPVSVAPTDNTPKPPSPVQTNDSQRDKAPVEPTKPADSVPPPTSTEQPQPITPPAPIKKPMPTILLDDDNSSPPSPPSPVVEKQKEVQKPTAVPERKPMPNANNYLGRKLDHRKSVYPYGKTGWRQPTV